MPWTAGALLPGGDLPQGSFAVFLRTLERRYPWLPAAVRRRYAQAYGTRIERVLAGATALADLGVELLPQLHEREVHYLCREEFAHTAPDILWRRSKLGLLLGQQDAGPLERWLVEHLGDAHQAPASSSRM
jgi:glycerol-3-phosphate dehydrogenase